MEETVTFLCNSKKLFGILHIADPKSLSGMLVCLVNGGPQTRAGGHRLYTQIARFLCSNGINVLRFDYEGMGDSEGDLVGFEGAGPSIIAAINFIKQKFSQNTKIVLWSVCDGCTISLLNADDLEGKISGLIMCNPLIIADERGLASAHLKHYYGRRIFKKKFWIRLIQFRINLIKELKSILDHFYKIGISGMFISKKDALKEQNDLGRIIFQKLSLISYPSCFIFSTEDIVGMKFHDLLNKHKYQRASIKQYVIKGADHTFTKSNMKQELFKTTLSALNLINQKGG